MSGHSKHNVRIIVHKGEEWDDGFILKKHSLQESVASSKIVKIRDAAITDSKPGMKNVSVQLEDFSQNVRLHAFAL